MRNPELDELYDGIEYMVAIGSSEREILDYVYGKMREREEQRLQEVERWRKQRDEEAKKEAK